MENQDLIRAICKQNLEGVDAYIRGGGDVNEFLYDGMTALVSALHNCNFRIDTIISLLIDAGSDVNARHPASGMTATMLAIQRRQSHETILKLINAGTNVSLVCKKGKTVLIYALENYCGKYVINKLINKGADVNNPSEGRTPLFCAMNIRKDADIINMLLDAGANVDSCKSYGNPFLEFRCRKRCKIDEVCEYKRVTDVLIRKGIDLKAIDELGNTVIHLLSCNYIFCLALKAGVSIDRCNNAEMTPLHQSLLYYDEYKVNDLLLIGANPNCMDTQGCTPLHYSEVLLSYQFINLLLFHGADLLAKNIRGNAPIDLMFSYEYIHDNDYFISGIKAIMKHYLLYVDENGLYESCSTNNNIRRKIYFLSFIGSCRKEIRGMRNKLLKEGMSIYDFCLTKKFYRSKLIPIGIDEYKYDYDNISIDFPIYQDIIRMRLKDNSRKQFKQDLIYYLERITVKAYFGCGTESSVEIIYDCWYLISKYLNFNQLYALFLASLDS